MFVRVRVKAGVRPEGVTQRQDGVLNVQVKVQAENGRANARLLELVAGWYRKPVSAVKIVTGHKTPNKVLSIKE